MLDWKSLYYLHKRHKASSEQYVEWAIREMESGIDDENVVALACLDFIQPLNHFEVLEAFAYLLDAEVYEIPTEEEAAYAYVRYLFQQRTGQWKEDFDLLKRMIIIARDECLLLENELYPIEERVEEAVYGDNVEEWTEGEINAYLYEQLATLHAKLFLSPSLQVLMGEVVERVENNPTFTIVGTPFRLIISGAWHLRQGSEVMAGSGEYSFGEVKRALQNEIISHVDYDEATSLLTLQMGAYTIHIFQKLASHRGWEIHTLNLKK